MNNKTPEQILTEFVLAQIENQPLEQRIQLYLAIAYTTQDKRLEADCRAIAESLEQAQNKHTQLLLGFRGRVSE
jgi:hypothetical protein